MRSTTWLPRSRYQCVLSRLAQVDGGLQNFILGLDGLRVGLVGALRDDHVDQFTCHIDVGGLYRTRHDTAQHAGACSTNQLLAGRLGSCPEVVTDRIQPLWI